MHTLLDCPVRYNGKHGKEYINRFINYIEAFKAFKKINDEQCLAEMPYLLEDHAYKWFQSRQHELNDWRILLERMRAFFSQVRPPHVLYRELFQPHIENKQTLEEFINSKLEIFAEMRPELRPTNIMQVDMIYGLLRKEVQNVVPRYNISDIDDLLASVQQYEHDDKIWDWESELSKDSTNVDFNLHNENNNTDRNRQQSGKKVVTTSEPNDIPVIVLTDDIIEILPAEKTFESERNRTNTRQVIDENLVPDAMNNGAKQVKRQKKLEQQPQKRQLQQNNKQQPKVRQQRKQYQQKKPEKNDEYELFSQLKDIIDRYEPAQSPSLSVESSNDGTPLQTISNSQTSFAQPLINNNIVKRNIFTQSLEPFFNKQLKPITHIRTKRKESPTPKPTNKRKLGRKSKIIEEQNCEHNDSTACINQTLLRQSDVRDEELVRLQ